MLYEYALGMGHLSSTINIINLLGETPVHNLDVGVHIAGLSRAVQK